jgi:hypothetical protein
MVTFWGKYFRSLALALSFSALSLLPGLGFSSRCDALSPELAASFKRHLDTIIRSKPRYVWGGISEQGIDCSGYLFLAAKRAAIPGIKRTTAYEMAHGRGGWVGVDILPDSVFGNVEECDIPFWTWRDRPDRPYGHVGVFLIGSSGLLEVTHSSESAGYVVLVPFAGPLVRDLAKIRRLTIGDK